MSAQTREALEQAMREHAADESDGKYLADWVVGVALAGADPDMTTYFYWANGATHSVLGLIEVVQHYIRGESFS